MANFIFNVAKGRVAQLVTNVENNSPASCCLRVIALEASGLEAQSALEDSLWFSEVIDGATNEQTSNFTRKQVLAAGIQLELDTTNNWYDLNMDDITWTAATGNAVGALVVCYDATGSDANGALLPLTYHDFAVTPDGSDIVAVIAAEGFYRAS